MSYFQSAGQQKRAWMRVGDTRPRIEVNLIRESDNQAYDISAGSAFVEVYKTDGAYLISGLPANLSEGAAGTVFYNWAAGDLALAGTYNVVFRLDVLNDGNYLSVPEEPYSYVLRVK
jgi:hypothetical protein